MAFDLRILTHADVRLALPMDRAIELMKPAFVHLSSKTAVVPTRLSMELPEQEGRVLIMPVYIPADEKISLKLVALHAQNPERGLPYIHALLILMDAREGRPLAIMDAEYLTALRTGAASGLATSLLSRPEAETVAIFGAGVQGRSQLEGICAVRPITRAFIYDPNPERVNRFCREMAQRVRCALLPADSPAVVQKADIIATATTAHDPVFDDKDIRAGTHINAIGAYRPDMREIPEETILRARVCVDSMSSCLEEAGDFLMPIRSGRLTPEGIHAELGEILNGAKAGRENPEEVTVFKSVGNAVQDLVAAQAVLAEAQRQNLGAAITL